MRHAGRLKRGGGAVRGDSVFLRADGETVGLDEFIISEEPTPELLAMMNEQHERLLNLLYDDVLREVAIRRMEGYTNDEIAAELGVVPRTIERKLQLIRDKWSRELLDV